MKKTLSLIGLLVVILATGVFLIFRIGSLGEEDNWFNRNFREKLISYPLFRQIFELHNDGDGRFDYLSPQRGKLVVEVDSIDGLSLAAEEKDSIRKKLSQITGKTVEIVESSRIPSSGGLYSDEELLKLASTYQIYHPSREQAVFYLLLAERSREDETLVGETIGENGAVLYLQAIKDIRPRHRRQAIISTVLHEFGHQLGLPHNDQQDCIMNPVFEVGGWFEEITTEFCDLELRQIENIRNSKSIL